MDYKNIVEELVQNITSSENKIITVNRSYYKEMYKHLVDVNCLSLNIFNYIRISERHDNEDN